MTSRLFALVDCNNFYASCERVFNPRLHNKPIVVLSNNDGCVIARSNQAKALGIAMGVPYFKVAQLCRNHGVAVFSSNYTLYGDMSRRVMDILQSETEHLEIYSIDEAFLQYTAKTAVDLLGYAQALRGKILQWTGLPVSIGLAPTKTLAKVANFIAKKETKDGVVVLTNPAEWQPILARLALADIWGIGARSAAKLLQLGIANPLALAQTSPHWIRHHFNITLERTVRELNGWSCHALENIQPRQQIIASRSFGAPVRTLPALIEAGCCHAVRAFEKLRQQNSVASHLAVFVSTSPFNTQEGYYSNMSVYRFPQPTQDSRLACHAVTVGLEKIFKAGKSYKKVGVIVSDLVDAHLQTDDFFNSHSTDIKTKPLMNLIDRINRTMGNNSLFLAAQGINRSWQTRSEKKSPCYTTRWEDLVAVN